VTARLHHERLVAQGASPRRWLAFTHGIYGSGANWRSVARKVIRRRPAWGAVLIDLRGHGRSEVGAPPYTLAACADDLAACLAELAAAGTPVDVVSGHSFGGKVALALRAGGARLAQTWVLDSTPSARPGAWDAADNPVRDLWQAMRELPRAWPHRDDFVEAMVARGHDEPTVRWLAMNLEPSAGGAGEVVLRLDLDAVAAMLHDYYVHDLWPAVEDPDLAGEVRMVIAARSGALSPADRARLADEPAARRVHTHVVADAAHWLHVDAPDAVVELFAEHLPASAT
jgi:esterase